MQHIYAHHMSAKQKLFVIGESVLVFLFLRYGAHWGKTQSLTGIFFLAAIIFFGMLFMFRERKVYWRAGSMFALFFLSAVLFLNFSRSSVQPFLAFFLSLIFFFFLLGFVLVWGRDKGDERHYFEYEAGMPIVVTLATLFFLSYSLFAFKIIFPIRFSGVAGLFFLLFSFLNYLNFSLWDLKQLSYRQVFSISTVVFLELFIILEFTPIAFVARSGIIAVGYYMFNGIIYLRSLPILDKKLLHTYITISLTALALIMILAEWR